LVEEHHLILFLRLQDEEGGATMASLLLGKRHVDRFTAAVATSASGRRRFVLLLQLSLRHGLGGHCRRRSTLSSVLALTMKNGRRMNVKSFPSEALVVWIYLFKDGHLVPYV
jgi:hypothetical protein